MIPFVKKEQRFSVALFSSFDYIYLLFISIFPQTMEILKKDAERPFFHPEGVSSVGRGLAPAG